MSRIKEEIERYPIEEYDDEFFYQKYLYDLGITRFQQKEDGSLNERRVKEDTRGSRKTSPLYANKVYRIKNKNN